MTRNDFSIHHRFCVNQNRPTGRVHFYRSGNSNYYAVGNLTWFLLGTGRMPHPVGGAMGVALCTAVKRDTPTLTSSH